MERCGVNLLCENSTRLNTHDMYWPYSGAEMREFIEYVNHPLFHGCWDTGHANCEGNQYEDILALGEELYAIHYNDNQGWRDQHLMPYLGTLNHDEVINALIAIGYKGVFTLECNSTLIKKDYWLGGRRQFVKDERLVNVPLFVYQGVEALTYKIAKHILQSYDLFEE